MITRIYKGRKINKMICLFFLFFTLLLFIAASICALFKNSAAGYTFCILALITGGFSLFYGVIWLIYGRLERKQELELREIFEGQNAPEDPYPLDYCEFILPKADLIKKAGTRLRRIVRWTGIAALGVFLLIGGIQLVCGSLRSPRQLLYMLLFCILIMIPGILIQFCLSLKYDQSVPSRILLFPGKLVIDNMTLTANEIREIRVSPSQIFNRNSPDVFREMLILTEEGRTKYRIDYRTGTAFNEQPFWEEYGQFIETLSEWGKKNNVPVTVSYMA